MPIATPTFPSPLVFSDSLPKASIALTPAIGTEFAPTVQLRALLSPSAPSTSIRDLAILVSQRGVVFFREQDLTTAEQRELVDRLGKETGRPGESGLHVHPLGGTDELGGGGKEEVFRITGGEFFDTSSLRASQEHGGLEIGRGKKNEQAGDPSGADRADNPSFLPFSFLFPKLCQKEFNGALEDRFNKSTRASNIWVSVWIVFFLSESCWDEEGRGPTKNKLG